MPRGIPPDADLHTVHLMAICGTGMGAFAGLLHQQGYRVTGSDAGIYPPMSTQLQALGVPLMDGFRAENLDHRPDLVVVGNVITRANPEARALLSSDLHYTSFPEALGQLFLSRRHPVVVTGTHGKTTTSALLAWSLLHAGRDPGFLVGGVMRNVDGNHRAGAVGAPFVVEGDEYDTAFFEKTPKFLHYRPRTAILTSVEFDHADIYSSQDAIDEAFRAFVELIPGEGLLLARTDGAGVDRVLGRASTRCRIATYGPRGDWTGAIVDTGEGGMEFDVLESGVRRLRARCLLVGEHNLENLVAVCAVLLDLGLSEREIAAALGAFQGIRRRQERFADVAGVTLLDDFAHHPTAVRETLAATRLRFGERRLWAVFEPRTNTSRTDVFQAEYGRAFDAADRVLIAPVDHPEKAPEGHLLDVERVAADVGPGARTAAGVDDIVATLVRETRAGDVVLLMSNGAFGGIYDALPAALARAARPGEG